MSSANGLRITVADLARSAPPRWAWSERLVIGYMNLLIGNEGIGKSTFICWVIARLTRGELPGDLRGEPINIGILGDEDDFDGVWTPRLHAAGADLGRVVQVDRPDGGYVNLTEDREALGQVVRANRLRMIFCDQLLDNLGVGVDDWRQKAVRDALQPIRSLARELDLLALGSLHPNKRADSFRQLVSGAAAFNAVSRSSLLLAAHPDDEERRVLCRGKGNLSKNPESIEFSILEHRFEANGFKFGVPLAADFTSGVLTVEDLIGRDGAREEHSRIAEACEIIEALLPRDGQWHPAKAIKEACATDGIEDHLAKRAKERLKVEHRRTSTFPAVTEWRWPIPTQSTLGTSVSAVPSAPTVPTGEGPKALLNGSWNRQNSQNTHTASAERVPTGGNA